MQHVLKKVGVFVFTSMSFVPMVETSRASDAIKRLKGLFKVAKMQTFKLPRVVFKRNRAPR